MLIQSLMERLRATVPKNQAVWKVRVSKIYHFLLFGGHLWWKYESKIILVKIAHFWNYGPLGFGLYGKNGGIRCQISSYELYQWYWYHSSWKTLTQLNSNIKNMPWFHNLPLKFSDFLILNGSKKTHFCDFFIQIDPES